VDIPRVWAGGHCATAPNVGTPQDAQPLSPMMQHWMEENTKQQPFNNIAQVLVETSSGQSAERGAQRPNGGCAAHRGADPTPPGHNLGIVGAGHK